MMTHEAFHEYLRSVAPAAPAWLNEGMAEYVSGITVRDGRVVEEAKLIRVRLKVLKIALKYDWEGIPFNVIFRESQKQFYAVAPQLQYAQAWSMVHFFMRYEDGRHRGLLERYLSALTAGKSSEDARRAAFGGVDIHALQREWLGYVRRLK